MYFNQLRQLGAFLFWNRVDFIDNDLHRVVPTLAYKLAYSNLPYAGELAAQIKATPEITKLSFDTSPSSSPGTLAAVATEHDPGLIIIILDALDECGTAQSRRQLLAALH